MVAGWDTPAMSRTALEAGTAALEDARWDAARRRFEEALAEAETPDARDGLGQALWFLGGVEEGIAARERAFEEYARAGRCDEAARVAVWVSHQYLIVGRVSAARGWLSRAERALEGADVRGPRLGGGRARAPRGERRGVRRARAAGDGDRARLRGPGPRGVRAQPARPRRGERRPAREGMAAARGGDGGGRGRPRAQRAHARRGLLQPDHGLHHRGRVGARGRVVRARRRVRAHERRAPLLGACRTVHADVLLATGRWPEAERALESALARHARYVPAMGAPTVATLAELRVRQGRLAEAEQLLAGREEHPSSLRALALLRIAEGRPQTAAALLERGLAGAEGDAMRATQLLAPLVDARLACGDLGRRRRRSPRAGRAARSRPGSRLVQRARRPRRRARRARDARSCRDGGSSSDDASRGRGGAPRARRVQRARHAARRRRGAAGARARARGRRSRARARGGARRARGVPRARRLARDERRRRGAARSRRGDRRAAARRSASSPRASRRSSGCSRSACRTRDRQTLVISEKTAGHHVSRILTKLGVGNRAEAAAHAARLLPMSAADRERSRFMPGAVRP